MTDLTSRLHARIEELQGLIDGAESPPWAFAQDRIWIGGPLDESHIAPFTALAERVSDEDGAIIVASVNLLPAVLAHARETIARHEQMTVDYCGALGFGMRNKFDQCRWCRDVTPQIWPCPDVLSIASMLDVEVEK